MILSPDQAAESLKEIEKTSRRSAQAFSYASASPYFILWGLIWIAGYAGSDLLAHPASDYLWPALTLLGIALCMVIGRRQGIKSGKSRAEGRIEGLRYLASFVVIACFITAAFAITNPRSLLAPGAFVPLVVAMFYGLMGVWKGIRFLVAGAVVAALTLGGFFHLHQHFLLWMAIVGGGSLVLVGLWLRKV